MSGKIKQILQALDECFTANSEPLSIAQIMAWIGVHYGAADFHPVTLKSQVYRSCVNVPFAQKYNTPKILFYDKALRRYTRVKNFAVINEPGSAYADGRPHDTLLPADSEVEDQSDIKVSMEAQLQGYLAKNLSKLELGLTFWQDTPPSVEYTIEGRRIDILAKDRNGTPVVVELKRDRAYDKVAGQALLYQALVGAKFKAARVRVIIVASEITPDLRLACSKQTDFQLFEYQLTMQFNPIDANVSDEEV